jgi:hypothetical protein
MQTSKECQVSSSGQIIYDADLLSLHSSAHRSLLSRSEQPLRESRAAAAPFLCCTPPPTSLRRRHSRGSSICISAPGAERPHFAIELIVEIGTSTRRRILSCDGRKRAEAAVSTNRRLLSSTRCCCKCCCRWPFGYAQCSRCRCGRRARGGMCCCSFRCCGVCRRWSGERLMFR